MPVTHYRAPLGLPPYCPAPCATCSDDIHLWQRLNPRTRIARGQTHAPVRTAAGVGGRPIDLRPIEGRRGIRRRRRAPTAAPGAPREVVPKVPLRIEHRSPSVIPESRT